MAPTRVTFAGLKEVITHHLRNNFGELDEVEVTFAKFQFPEWRANVEFVVHGGRSDAPRTALFRINAISGDVVEFQQGNTWRD